MFVVITFSVLSYFIHKIFTSNHSILNFIPIYHFQHLQTAAGINFINIMDMFVDHRSCEWYKHINMLLEIYF